MKFDSEEEQEFYWWCEEAVETGVIDSFFYHPEPLVLADKQTYPVEKKLKTKNKVVDKHILHGHLYTPDFIISSKNNVLGIERYGHLVYIVDVKGSYSIYNNHREFSLNRKWVWQKYKLYVNQVDPKKFFKKQWVPLKAIITPKTKKVRSCYRGYKDKNQKII